MGLLYVAVCETGITPHEADMRAIEAIIKERDGIEDLVLVCVNDSAELGTLLESINFNDGRNWGSLVVLMIPNEGEIYGYRPLRLTEKFKTQACPGIKSYDLFSKILRLPS